MFYFISPTYLQPPCQSTAQVLGTVAYFFIAIVLILGLLKLFSMWKLLISSLHLKKNPTLPVFFKVNWKALTIKIHVWISQHYACSYQSIHCYFSLPFITWQYNSSVLLPQSKKLCVHLPGQWIYPILDTVWSGGTKMCKLLCSSEMDSFSILPYWMSSRMPTVAEEIVLIMCL